MSEHADENRAYWNGHAHERVERGERAWASAAPYWGVFEVSNTDLPILPDDLAGRAAIELGCGTGYGSAWMARRGASVFGIDISEEQLRTAHRLQDAAKLDIVFAHGDAENVPRPDGSFDFALSEYGAAIWCDPEVWLREAHRLLRDGGRLVFLGTHPLVVACFDPAGEHIERRLHRPYRGMRSVDWRNVSFEPGGIEFNRTFADWFALFRAVGFRRDDYREVYAPAGATASHAEWAREFPYEQVFWLTKR